MSAEVNARARAAEKPLDKSCTAGEAAIGSAGEKLATHSDIKERLRNDGLQTVSKLLHESRAENKILKDKNSQLERAVDSLNNRLQKSGTAPTSSNAAGGGGELRTNSNQNPDDDLNLPSSSRNLVENLIRENNRLKHQIHNPQKIDELSMKACSLQSLNNSLKQDKTRLEHELENLKSLIHLTDKDKDRQIVQLLEVEKESKDSYQRERSHRFTLEGEINKLNDELTDTAQKCLNMRKQLPTPAGHSQSTENKSGSLPLTDVTLSGSLNQQLAQEGASQMFSERSLIEQNSRLEGRCKTLERELKLAKSQSASMSGDRLTAEVKMLRDRLVEKDVELVALRDQCHTLHEQCQLLKHQVHAYQEDFRKERKDRELTKKKFSQMEEHYREIRSQMPVKQNPGNNAWDGRQHAASRPRPVQQGMRLPSQASKANSRDNQPQPSKLAVKTAHKPDSAGAKANNPHTAEDNISLTSQTEVVRPNLSTRQQTELTCYKCDEKFGADRHSELIDHLDICQGSH